MYKLRLIGFRSLTWITIFLLSVVLFGCDKVSEPFGLNSAELYAAKGNGVGGNKYGNITVLEFFDYRCHACRLSFPALHTLGLIDPSVRIVYRELPILGYVSEIAAKAALASRYQNKYLIFHNALMSSTALHSLDDIYTIAEKVGLDVPQLKKDMNRAEIRAHINENFAMAKALNFAVTPVFIIAKTYWKKNQLSASNAVLVRGAMTLTDFKRLIVSIRLSSE